MIHTLPGSGGPFLGWQSPRSRPVTQNRRGTSSTRIPQNQAPSTFSSSFSSCVVFLPSASWSSSAASPAIRPAIGRWVGGGVLVEVGDVQRQPRSLGDLRDGSACCEEARASKEGGGVLFNRSIDLSQEKAPAPYRPGSHFRTGNFGHLRTLGHLRTWHQKFRSLAHLPAS